MTSISTLIDLPFSLLFVFYLFYWGADVPCAAVMYSDNYYTYNCYPIIKNVSEKIIRFGRQKESVLWTFSGYRGN